MATANRWHSAKVGNEQTICPQLVTNHIPRRRAQNASGADSSINLDEQFPSMCQNASAAGTYVNLDEQLPSMCLKGFTRGRVLASKNCKRKESLTTMKKLGQTRHLFSKSHTIRVSALITEPEHALGVGPCTMEPLILKLLMVK